MNKFRIETRTYDTLMVSALELMWNHGAIFKIERDVANNRGYIVDYLVGDIIMVIKAMQRLQRWIFELDIMPIGSTIDAGLHDHSDWIFAPMVFDTG